MLCSRMLQNLFSNEVKYIWFIVQTIQSPGMTWEEENTSTALREEELWDEGSAQGRGVGKTLNPLGKTGKTVPWKCPRRLSRRVDCWKEQDQGSRKPFHSATRTGPLSLGPQLTHGVLVSGLPTPLVGQTERQERCDTLLSQWTEESLDNLQNQINCCKGECWGEGQRERLVEQTRQLGPDLLMQKCKIRHISETGETEVDR